MVINLRYHMNVRQSAVYYWITLSNTLESFGLKKALKELTLWCGLHRVPVAT